MKKYLLLSIFTVLSCQEKETQEQSIVPVQSVQPVKKKKFEMYEMSEMALLMEQMYVDNQRLKERIKKGDTIGKFPNHFLKIHQAVMTDKQENDSFFKKEAAKFIQAQKLIYEDPANAKKHFNDGVNACITCHQVKCTGPIERIKNLYIE